MEQHSVNNLHADAADREDVDVPEGFVPAVDVNGERCIVPAYLLPATKLAFASHQKRIDLDVRSKDGGSRNESDHSFALLGDNAVVFPPDPSLTTREMLGLHADVMALRETLGISYKDASHRLYMAEWEKLKIDDKSHKSYNILSKRTRHAVEDLHSRFCRLTAEAEAEPVVTMEADDSRGAECTS